jgi:hypothetical protein
VNTRVNLEAPIAALTLLGTGLLIGIAAIVMIQSLLVLERQRAKVDSAKPARLLVNEGDWITHLVIGHENSSLQKKTEFQL